MDMHSHRLPDRLVLEDQILCFRYFDELSNHMDWSRNYYRYVQDIMCNCKFIQLLNTFYHFGKVPLVNIALFHSLHRNIRLNNSNYMKYHFALLHHRSARAEITETDITIVTRIPIMTNVVILCMRNDLVDNYKQNCHQMYHRRHRFRTEHLYMV